MRKDAPMRRLVLLVVLAWLAAAGGLLPATTARRAVAAENAAVLSGITSRRATFYVLASGDRNLPPLITISVADELNKHLSHSFGTDGSNAAPNPSSPPSGDVWAIPEPEWDATQLNAQCLGDPNALGGVIVTTYSGFATHFWLLWQTETTSFSAFAQIVSCNHSTGGEGHAPVAQVIGIVAHVPGAGNSPWVVRRTQTSIPLLTAAALTFGFTKNFTTGQSSTQTANNLTLVTVASAVGGLTGAKDIPGYSDPIRLRLATQHIGVDVVDSMTWLCGHTGADGGLKDVTPGTALCSALRFST
jgi:hypothetical protein